MPNQPARFVVLISGNGSNLQAVMDACQAGRFNAQVVAVFSSKFDVYGLQRAARAGIPAIAVPKPKELDRQIYDADLAERVAAFEPDCVLLLGWMRILTSAFLDRFHNRVINLHPALPGTFPGTHAIERAFEAYQNREITYTGVMVHRVPDEGVDCGPVLGTEIVPIFPEDCFETLEARVHQTEHHLLLNVLAELLIADQEQEICPILVN
ncbi:MAG: phosphoribosylglycinamide formyltransferase [Anaerolineaceae bacterium]